MDKRLFFVCFLLSVALLRAVAIDTIRLDMQRYMQDYPIDDDGKWEYTFSSDYQWLDFDIFSFSHIRGAATDSEMKYWDGFTLCTNGDNNDYGFAGSSGDWPTHQWGCMAGGGISLTGETVKGLPYIVAYWGENYESAETHSLQVDFSDGLTHRPLGVWICNHPWPYYGIEHDDAFAHSFADNGALFCVTAHGLDEEGKEAGQAIMIPLASFHDDALHQSADWQWFDLSRLGQVNGIYFTMESTDNAQSLGMNTAAYFCLGGMDILEHVDDIPRPTGLEAEAQDEHQVRVSWTRVREAAYYRLYVDSVLIDSTTATSFVFKDLHTYTRYHFYAQAVSAYGESSDWGFVEARTLDLTPPSAPSNLQAETDTYKIHLSWDKAQDNVAVSKYVVYVNGKRYTGTKFTSATITGLDAGTTYFIEVEALDTSDNVSERISLTATTHAVATSTDDTNAEEKTQAYTLLGQPMGNDAKNQIMIINNKKQLIY